MTVLQRVIKYCAVTVGVLLIAVLILGVIRMTIRVSDGGAGAKQQAYTADGDVERLEIDVGAADLQIVTGDSLQVESSHRSLRVREQDGTLRISARRAFFDVYPGEFSVVLTVPEDVVFADASITAGAGSVQIDTLRADTLSLELGAGETRIGSLYAQTSASIRGGAGKLCIGGGELRDLTVELGVGKLELTGKLTGSSTLDYGVGGVELTLLGGRDAYRITLDKGVGDAALGGRAMADGGVYGDGENYIAIDGSVGSVSIEFA